MKFKLIQALAAIMIAVSGLNIWAEEVDTNHLENLRPFDYEVVVLKDGTKLCGFIDTQYADGSIKFRTLISKRIGPLYGLENPIPRSHALLPDNIKRSLKRYEPFVETLGLKETVKLAKYNSNPDNTEDIIVLEESQDSISFISFISAFENIDYEEIDERINFDLPDDASYGLRDRVTTADGKIYTGRITHRRPGRNIVVSSEGTDRNISLDKVDITEIICLKPSSPVSAQTPFNTKIHFKNGDVIEGTIIYMNFETGEMRIVNRNNDTIYCQMDDLDRREYAINPIYPPKEPVRLDYSESKIYADTVLLNPLNPDLSNKNEIKQADLREEATVIKLSGDSITISMAMSNESAITLTSLPYPTENKSKLSRSQLTKGKAPQTRSIIPDLDASVCIFRGLRNGYYILSLLKSDQLYVLKLE